MRKKFLTTLAKIMLTTTSILLLLLTLIISRNYLYAYTYESVGTSSASNDLTLQSPKAIYFHTNMSSSEADNNSKARMIIDENGNVGLGTTAPADAVLHVNGTIRTATPTENYHAATKQYTDTNSLNISLTNCQWTGDRGHYHDDEETCLDFGAGYVMVGMDFQKSSDKIKYNAIRCCRVETSS